MESNHGRSLVEVPHDGKTVELESQSEKLMKKGNLKRLVLYWAGVVCLGGLFSVCTAHASDRLVLGDILKKTESYYKGINAFTAHFRQTTASAAAGTMKTEASGVLYYEKPRQMRWEYTEPEAQVFVANHELAWLYVPSEKQFSLFDAGTFFSSPLAQTFFDGMVELRKNFEVNLDSKQTTQDAAVLRLIPRQEDPNIQSLLLWVDLATYRILSIESRDALGNTNRIVLETQKPEASLDHKLFELDIPPAAVVVDSEGRELNPSEIQKLKAKLPSK